MTNEQLEAKLKQADEAANSGNLDLAEQLANQALAALEESPLALPLSRGEGREREENSPLDKGGEGGLERGQRKLRALLILASVSRLRGNYPAALERYAAAQAAAENANDTSGFAKAMNGFGVVYYSLDSYDKALEYYAKALAVAQELGEKSEIARITGNIGIVYANLGSYDKALEYYAKALAAHEELGVKSGVARVTGNIGGVYQYLGSYSKALEYYAKALSAHEELGAKSSVALVTGNIGLVYANLGSYDKALEYYAKALAAHEELGAKSGVARVTGNIGNVYWNLGSYDKALEYYAKALSAHEELGAKSSVALVTGNIGLVYCFLGSYDKALEYYAKALAAHEELGAKSGVARVTGNIGNVYWNLGSYDKALEYYAKALSALEELGVKSGVASVTGNIGLVYQNLGSYDKALEYYAKALAIHEELGEKSLVANVSGNIGRAYFELKEYAKALDYQKRALALAEEIGDRRQTGYWLAGIGSTLSAMGKKQKAMEYLQKALHLRRDELQTNEGVAGTLVAIGVLLAEQNKNDDALEKLEEGLALAEELGEKAVAFHAHKELATILKKKKKIAASYKHFEKYHELEKEVQSEEAKKTAQRYQIEREQAEISVRLQTTEQLLNKTLPPTISKRLMKGEKNIADRFESVSILFADIVGFTPLSARLEPQKLVELLNKLFSRFDRLTEEYGVERIKTIGDAYMIVAGAPERCEDHAIRMAKVAVGMLDQTELFCKEVGESIQIRIGISSGEVIGAIVGETKFTYDFWSDAVNTASRMESHGEAGRIHVSNEFKEALTSGVNPVEVGIHFTERGELDIKGKGKMRTYFLENRSKQ